jgi:hypothetical protein
MDTDYLEDVEGLQQAILGALNPVRLERLHAAATREVLSATHLRDDSPFDEWVAKTSGVAAFVQFESVRIQGPGRCRARQEPEAAWSSECQRRRRRGKARDRYV